MKGRLSALVLTLAAGLSGCSTAGFYWQAAQGHLSLMQAARPISDWLADAQTPEPLKARLQQAVQIRRFASEQLQLPDNKSYLHYADLRRPAAVWTVVAAPPWSLEPRAWCFLVAGCVNYRGYFDPQAAEQEARRLAQEGLETVVLPVPAYSTLGLLNWAGGDPLLNTFFLHGQGELARLIFHELAHQVVYVAGDTAFNESYATAVERLGLAQWLGHAGEPVRAPYEVFEQRRRQWRELTLQLRRQLHAVYEKALAEGADQPQLQREKQAAFDDFARRYRKLRTQWGQFAGYDRWAERMNNAFLAALADYEDLVPGFEALFARSQGWADFHQQVRDLARQPKAERHRHLRQLGQAQSPDEKAVAAK